MPRLPGVARQGSQGRARAECRTGVGTEGFRPSAAWRPPVDVLFWKDGREDEEGRRTRGVYRGPRGYIRTAKRTKHLQSFQSTCSHPHFAPFFPALSAVSRTVGPLTECEYMLSLSPLLVLQHSLGTGKTTFQATAEACSWGDFSNRFNPPTTCCLDLKCMTCTHRTWLTRLNRCLSQSRQSHDAFRALNNKISRKTQVHHQSAGGGNLVRSAEAGNAYEYF